MAVNGVAILKKPNFDILKIIRRKIELATMTFGEELAVNVANKAKENALTKTQNITGRLAESIHLIEVSRTPSYTRYDVVTKSIYAPWIELGANTPEGLPYSNPASQIKYNKDYSSSSYKGIKFMSNGARYWNNQTKYGPMFYKILIKKLRQIKK